MGKDKRGKVVSMPKTPENYFKSGRARALPLHECLVSETGQVGGIVNILLSRKHVNGNISWAVYLVDTFCMGIRHTIYIFNQSEDEYNECKREYMGDGHMSSCSYSLIHNMIYGAIAYADTCGFKPCKDFSISRFLLKEEDGERIKKMDIEFGLQGKPTYLAGDEDENLARIISTLERHVGKGNYLIIEDEDDWQKAVGIDEDEDDWDEDEDDEKDDDDGDDGPVFGKGEMEEIASGKKSPDLFQAFVIADSFYESYFPDEKNTVADVEEVYLEFNDLMKAVMMNSPEYDAHSDEVAQRLASALPVAVERDGGIAEADKMIMEYPYIYDLCQLRLLLSAFEDFSSPETLFDGFYKRFPGRPLSKILRCGHLISLGEPEKGFDVLDRKHHMTEAFPENNGIFSEAEIFSYYAVMCRYYAAVDDLTNSRLFAACIVEYGDLDDLTTHLAIKEVIEKMTIKTTAKMGKGKSSKDESFGASA